MAIVLLECALIAGFFWERRRRRHSQKLLSDRLRYEIMLASVSARFAELPFHELTQGIPAALSQFADFAEVDVAGLFAYRGDGALELVGNSELAVSDSSPILTRQNFPYILGELGSGRSVRLAAAQSFPKEAAEDQRNFAGLNSISLVAIPITVERRVANVLILKSRVRERQFSDLLVTQLRTLGEILSTALARCDFQRAGETSEALSTAMLSSVSVYVVVVDRSGCVLRTNQSFPPLARVEVGTSYYSFWKHKSLADREYEELSDALEGVLDGSFTSAVMELRHVFGSEERWLALRVEYLDRAEGGAVITHRDISQRKQAELQSARDLAEVFHLNRVSAVGEISSSLAHEINQPLTAIVANGQAAAALIQQTPLDQVELRETIADIVEAGQRAGAVVRNMQKMIRKGPPTFTRFDVNVVAAETVRLVGTAAHLEQVNITLELLPNLPQVSGDPIQIQQVILNLVNNAIDAMKVTPLSSRYLSVRTGKGRDGGVVLEVSDSGPGVPAAHRQSVFRPFFSTKREGLGVGLSISRSIIACHGGSIWVEPAAGGGAKFCFFLPVETAYAAAV